MYKHNKIETDTDTNWWLPEGRWGELSEIGKGD